MNENLRIKKLQPNLCYWFYEIHKIKFWPIADSSHYIFIYYLTLLNCWHYVSNIENYERKKSKFVKNLWLEIAKLSSNSNFNSVCSCDSLTLSPTGGVGGNLSSFAIAQKRWELGRWFFWLFTLHALIYLMKIPSLKYDSFDDFQPPSPIEATESDRVNINFSSHPATGHLPRIVVKILA